MGTAFTQNGDVGISASVLARMSIFWVRSVAMLLFKRDEPLLKKFGEHFQEMEVGYVGAWSLGLRLWSFPLRHVFVNEIKIDGRRQLL